MWSVLRRYQGVAHGPEPGSGPVEPGLDTPATRRGVDPFAVNQRAIVAHQCRENPPADDPTVLTAPYGARAYSKYLRHSRHESVDLRRKALSMLLELYAQKTEHVVLSLREGAPNVVVDCLTDSDEEVRVSAAVALQLIVSHPLGQQACLPLVGRFLQSLEDTSSAVVTEVLRLCSACHAVHNEFLLTKELIAFGAIKKYVALCASPNDDLCAAALNSLGKTFDVKEGFIVVLDNHGLAPLTTAVTKRSDPLVLVEAAECIGKLAFYSAGKRAAVHEHTVEPVAKLITHADPVVRTAASGALVALTVSEAGKSQAIEAGVVAILHSALQSEDERDVLINEVKTICNVSEHPVARQQLHSTLPRLEEMITFQEFPSLVENARRCIALIQWQPGQPRN